MRFLISLVVGLISGFLLFLLMQSLISGSADLDQLNSGSIALDFVHIEEDQNVKLKERVKPPPPPPPKEPPPPPKMEISRTDKPPPTPMDFDAPDVDLPSVSGSGPYLGAWTPGSAPPPEGDAIPIVRMVPQYPRKQALDGTEGWVKLQFTINPDGSVSNPTVLDSDPRRVFDSAAKKAISRWKYKPQVIDGQAVSREWVSIMEFKLNQ